MAQIFPSIENIERLKVQPTDGEWFILNYLIDSLDDDFEIYFQPFLGVSRPDVIILKKGCGVAIVEVKDWMPGNYSIDSKNRWRLKKNNQPIKSPYKQVFSYKKNIFTLHVSGLLENQIENSNFWNVVTPFVYFHNFTKLDLNNLFSDFEGFLDNEKNELNSWYRGLTPDIRFEKNKTYNKKFDYFSNKQKQLSRDKGAISITQESLNKISESHFFKYGNSIFDIETYYEFKRVLQPPYHVLEEGKEIIYTKKQLTLSKSKDEHRKVKGVAGSGKTLTLAKRAVNAHKRHGDHVLILTYNLTLKSYIRDRISDVREGFNWGYFHITNYHQLILESLNIHGKELKVPDGDQAEDYLDQLFGDINLFDDIAEDIYKFRTILIDEIQDYKPEWVKIIRKYFLGEGAEMVLFGDEKQNIYERDLDKDNTSNVPNGFKRWQMLNKPIRNKQYSPMLELSKDFQKEFLSSKYDIDKYEEDEKVGSQVQMFSVGKIFTYSDGDISNIVPSIFNYVKKEGIASDDFAIICSRITTIQEIDFIARNKYKQETITTFISKELKETLYKDLKRLYSDKDVNKNKKVQFQHHSGAIKLSTIHSYKGFESPTVFLILGDPKVLGYYDQDEMVYTGITRAISNIIIFIHKDSKYKAFFESHLQSERLINT